MKIIYLMEEVKFHGGLERVIIRKINYFSQVLGYEVIILTSETEEGEYFYKFPESVKVYDLGINYNEINGMNFIRRKIEGKKREKKHLEAVKKYVSEFKPDVIISSIVSGFSFMHKIGDRSKKIGEYHFCKDYFSEIAKMNNSRCYRKVWAKINTYLIRNKVKKLDKFVVLTEEDKKNWNLKNTVTIPNVSSFTEEKSSSLNNKIFISVGRLSKEKGYDLLIDSWKIVNKKYPDWKLEIYGEGPERENLEDKILGNNLDGTILLKGICKNIQEKYLQSSGYVMSSRYEGFGLVLVEAMECGVPVISFSCPTGPENIIQDGIDGYLVENGNIEELAKKIMDLISDIDKRKFMGKNAKADAKRFHEDVVMEKWKNLLENLK